MKTLLNILKAGAGLVAAVSLAIGVASCKLPEPNPSSPPKAKAELIVSPTSGYNPLNVNMKLNGTGVEYAIGIDNNSNNQLDANEVLTSSSSPINYSTIFDTAGNRKILGEVTDSQGNCDRKSIDVIVSEPPIVDYLDVEGYLQDNETDTGKQGTVKIYDSANLTTPIETIPVDSTGHFIVNIDKKISDLSGVVVEAISTDANGVQNSYVRTKTFPAGDVTINPIRVVPYPTFCSNADFKTHMGEINIDSLGLKKWDLNHLQGIEILSDYSNYSSTFDSNQQNKIVNKIKDPSNVEIYVRGKQLDSLIQVDGPGNVPPSGKTNHYNTDTTGWIIVVPNKNLTGQTFFPPVSNIINSAWIEINPSSVNDTSPVVSHEFGHAFIARSGEASTISPNYTLMWTSGNVLTKPGVADQKAAHIVYEDTYQPGEKLDDILGTTF